MNCHNFILIVEDEPDLRDTLKMMLELKGFNTMTAANGREAYEILKQTDKKICLMLLDLMMPVMNGWELLDILRREYNDLLAAKAAVVISAAVDAMDVQLDYGIPVLKKPAGIDTLVNLANEHC